MPSRQFLTSSVHGSCSCRALIQEETTPCARCRHHDEGIWSTAKQLMGIDDATDPECQQLASLTMRMGSMGLRSATRCARAAFWASWADALPMIKDRTPQIAHQVVTSLSSAQPAVAGCLAELHEAATVFDQQGFWWRPSWTELLQGKRPDSSEARDPGELQHGWQYWASSVCDSSFRKTTMLTNRPASRRAHLRSYSGRNAGVAFSLSDDARVHDSSPIVLSDAVGASGPSVAHHQCGVRGLSGTS